MTAADTLALLDWKRRVFSLYAAVRALEPAAGWALWRESRDELFRSHPPSPPPAERPRRVYRHRTRAAARRPSGVLRRRRVLALRRTGSRARRPRGHRGCTHADRDERA